MGTPSCKKCRQTLYAHTYREGLQKNWMNNEGSNVLVFCRGSYVSALAWRQEAKDNSRMKNGGKTLL